MSFNRHWHITLILIAPRNLAIVSGFLLGSLTTGIMVRLPPLFVSSMVIFVLLFLCTLLCFFLISSDLINTTKKTLTYIEFQGGNALSQNSVAETCPQASDAAINQSNTSISQNTPVPMVKQEIIQATGSGTSDASKVKADDKHYITQSPEYEHQRKKSGDERNPENAKKFRKFHSSELGPDLPHSQARTKKEDQCNKTVICDNQSQKRIPAPPTTDSSNFIDKIIFILATFLDACIADILPLWILLIPNNGGLGVASDIIGYIYTAVHIPLLFIQFFAIRFWRDILNKNLYPKIIVISLSLFYPLFSYLSNIDINSNLKLGIVSFCCLFERSGMFIVSSSILNKLAKKHHYTSNMRYIVKILACMISSIIISFGGDYYYFPDGRMDIGAWR